jgi:SAM-dependent MidA family methyltransferase
MNPLAVKIGNLIRRNGPISFRQFMEIALYDPEHGYYSKQREIGQRGDYYTGANIHPLFGELLAEKSAELVGSLDSPGGLSILEVGAGTGRLAQDILETIARGYPQLRDQLTYSIAERSPSLQLVQQDRLKAFARVQWKSLSELDAHSVIGIIFSNELVDAFPVHRVMYQQGQWREMLVDCQEEQFGWALGEVSSDELVRFLREYPLPLEEGQIAEVNLEAIEYLKAVAGVLRQGYVITIDYGGPRDRLYSAARRDGTLRCFYRHTLTTDPFERIGQQDITASVDFTALMEYGRRVGLETMEFKSLRQFLMDQGLMERLIALEQNEGDALTALKSKLAAKHFLMPGALGDHFKVLIQQRKCA